MKNAEKKENKLKDKKKLNDKDAEKIAGGVDAGKLQEMVDNLNRSVIENFKNRNF